MKKPDRKAHRQTMNLGDLIMTVSSCSKNNREMTAAVVDLLESGRVLVQAPRDEPAVLVADLELDQRGDWLDLFPFLTTRRPDTYGPLVTETP